MTILTLVTSTGEQHGLINQLTNNVPFDGFKNFAPDHKAKLEKEKKEDSRIVKAEYVNRKGRLERLEKHYCRYAGDPIQQWKFIPGYTYHVPYGLVKEINDKSKIMKKRSGLLSLDGEPVKEDKSPLEHDMDGDWEHKFIAPNFAL